MGIGDAFRTLHRPPSAAYLKDRPVDRSVWENAYAGDLPDVNRVLFLIQQNFLLRPEDVWRLRPGDRLLDAYRAAYPTGGADTMEFEGLLADLEREFQVDVDALPLSNLTVSAVVDACLARATRAF